MLADIVKIHCLKHHADFPMPRTSRIVVCKEGADEHTLSENFPYSGSWIYCCNCQSFISWETGQGGVSVKQCPFCFSSLNPRGYACDHCAVTMLDFDDQTLRKHHAVLSWGMPQPACPACHQFPRATPKQHLCHILGIHLATARPSCPFCKTITEAPPANAAVMATKLDAALADAEERAREAEERRRLAEDAARKEIELRRQAERKAEEIEKKAARELAQSLAEDSELARKQAKAATAKAEAEARARAEAEKRAFAEAIERQEAEWRKTEAEARAREAEERAREIEELRIQAEATAIKEVEKREMAELRARQMSERAIEQVTGDFAELQPGFKPVSKRNLVAIAVYAGAAVVLFFALILIIWAIIRSI
jgi:hypothetical protein